MIRIILLNLLLLLLPTVLYVGYTHLTSPGTPKGLGRILEGAPLPWLLLTGSVLAVGTMLFFGTPPDGRPGDRYHPPVFRDGKIVPGRLGDDNDEATTPGGTQP